MIVRSKPLSRQTKKLRCTVDGGATSLGNIARWQPVAAIYKTVHESPSKTSRGPVVRGRPIGFGAGSNGAHSLSVVSAP